MAKVSIVKGTTSYLARVFVQDSTSTTGAGKTGLAFGSVTCYQARDDDGNAGGTVVALVTATKGTWTSKGWIEKDSSNMPGVYEFGVPNAGLATSSKSVMFYFTATGAAPCVLEIELTAIDNQDAVHGGMSALPATACTTNASLITSGSGTDQLTVTGGLANSDAKKINAVATTSVTAVNANVGQTQPINFTGTAGSALVKSDMVDVAGAAVSAASAQIGVNAVNVGGTAQTGRDLGASVLLSSGTGTGQLDVTSGIVKSNLTQILGTLLTETAGQIAGGFKKFFNIATPAATMDHGVLVDTATVATTATNLTNAPTAGDFTATMKTSLNAATPVATVSGDLSATMKTSVQTAAAAALTAFFTSSVQLVTDVWGFATRVLTAATNLTTSLATPTNITAGTITTVTNLTNAPTAGDFTATMKTSLNAATPVVTLAAGQVQWKKNTALANFEFVMTDATTHAPKTGLTVSAARNIDNAGFGACTNAVSEVASGFYVINLSAADLNGDVIAFRMSGTGADDLCFTVVTHA